MSIPDINATVTSNWSFQDCNCVHTHAHTHTRANTYILIRYLMSLSHINFLKYVSFNRYLKNITSRQKVYISFICVENSYKIYHIFVHKENLNQCRKRDILKAVFHTKC